MNDFFFFFFENFLDAHLNYLFVFLGNYFSVSELAVVIWYNFVRENGFKIALKTGCRFSSKICQGDLSTCDHVTLVNDVVFSAAILPPQRFAGAPTS